MSDSVLSPDGTSIHFEQHGAGDSALVFVHGFSCDRTYWRHQVNPFSAGHRVVTIDLAGHGQSAFKRKTWTMPAYGDDVAAVVKELELTEVVLIGHSMGGDVIVEAALNLDGVARGLIWVDTYTALGTPRTPAEIEEFVAPFREDFVAATDALVRRMFLPGSDPALVDWIASDMSSAPPEVAINELLHSISNDGPVLGRLERLSIPKVAINAGYHPTDAESLARYGFETVVMPAVGHFMMMEDPHGFNRLLAETLARFG